MFDFIFQNKKGEYQSVMDILSIDIKKLKLAELAKEKAIGMIAHAIAKSEFIVQGKNGRERNELYWKLNVQPNKNETATDFWVEVVQKLLKERECLIILLDKNFYIADSFDVTDSVLKPSVYKNIILKANNGTLKLKKKFNPDEVIHLKAKNKNLNEYLKHVTDMHANVVSSMETALKMSKTPKFLLKVLGSFPVLRSLKSDGTEVTLTIDEFKNNIKTLIESDKIEILQTNEQVEISQFKIDTSVTSDDIIRLSREIFDECAFAFDIPKTVFCGEITEKADSTNEFITYAVSWIAEIINDSLNAVLVGESSYLEGENVWIDLSRFKHRDLIESANNMDKLRAIGFTLDEIRWSIGWEPLNTEFSTQRVITKNYTNDLSADNA